MLVFCVTQKLNHEHRYWSGSQYSILYLHKDHSEGLFTHNVNEWKVKAHVINLQAVNLSTSEYVILGDH